MVAHSDAIPSYRVVFKESGAGEFERQLNGMALLGYRLDRFIGPQLVFALDEGLFAARRAREQTFGGKRENTV